MLVSANNLKDLITTRLATNPGGLDLCQLANANTEVSTGYRVASSSCLPSATCNMGKFAYINNECAYVFSTGSRWSTDFNSRVRPVDDITGKFFGTAYAGDGVCFQRLFTSEYQINGNCSCVYGPQTVKFCCSDIYEASDINLSAAGSLFYIKNGCGYAFGNNGAGHLGIGNSNNVSAPTPIAGGISNWKQISSNSSYTLGLTSSGEVWAWGSNNYGQLGDCTTIAKSSPIRPCLSGSNWCYVHTTGKCSSFAVDTSGNGWAWGKNYYGQLGTNDCTDCNSPRPVLGSGWCKINGGQYHTLGITVSGTLWGWGYGSGGRTGVGDQSNRASPTQVAGGGTNWVDASTTLEAISVGLKSDGTVWTWGYGGAFRMQSPGVSDRSSPGSALLLGSGWTCFCGDNRSNYMYGIKTDGTLWTWGDGDCRFSGFYGADQNFYACCGPVPMGHTCESYLKFFVRNNNGIGIASCISGI